jgi:serine protease Do
MNELLARPDIEEDEERDERVPRLGLLPPPAEPPEPPQPPEPPEPPEPPLAGHGRRSGWPKRTIAAIAASSVLMAGGYGLRAVTTPDAPAAAATASGSATTASIQTGDLSALVKRSEKSVVEISSQVVRQATSFSPPQSGTAVGTGFIVTANGLIVTNYHVVEGARSITVKLSDGTQHAARVVKADAAGDLAVLKIEATGLPTLQLGNSSTALAGQSVVAIGYALGLEGSPTVTTGIVSSTGRTIQVQDDGAPGGPVVRTYSNVLQISAAINSGNSGGPLLDLRGRVIGINTAGSSSAQNIGFAIPIDQARSLIASAIGA